MSNLLKLVCVTAFLFSSSAMATAPYSCPKGWQMTGSIASNSVQCMKLRTASEIRKKNRISTLKSYRKDASDRLGTRVKKNKKIKKHKPNKKRRQKQPRIMGGKDRAFPGDGKYVTLKRAAQTKPVRYCKPGWQMKGDVKAQNGRGTALCSNAEQEGPKPRCYGRVYTKDFKGKTQDMCVTKSDPSKLKKPVCADPRFGTYKVRKGYDACYSREKHRRPWKK